MGELLSEREFLDLFSKEFDHLDPADVTPDARVIEDLGLDSFELFRLWALVESLEEFELPEDLDLSGLKIGDVYYYYETICSRIDR